ncbi:MAG: indole-3-glycerol phosphate synthase TrpC [Candidatus Kerfeldbacteria bacterium]|nr:indole-3-glycerol phosphate synthase TrpC [Candidatus Kerfeldbacteria bacterium]
MTILDTIYQYKQHELDQQLQPQRDFAAALRSATGLAVIAEFKQASPSAGMIRTGAVLANIVTQYYQGGARALSILTDQHFFQGQLDYINQAKQAVPLPVLRKDFIFHPFQVYESKLAGADAILLIAAKLTGPQLQQLVALAHSLGLQTLVEIHTTTEVDRAIACQPTMFGVNARNLHTMIIDLHTIARIVPLLPSSSLIVFESGITSRADVAYVRQAGVKAILIGTTLMQAEHPQLALEQLIEA